MNKTDSGISKAIAVLLTCVMFCFTHFVQAQTVAKASAFDHTKTGFLLKDAHLTLKCEQCHVEGIFKNTPKDCEGCHATGTRVGATPKPLNHVPTRPANAPCETCHTSAANFLVKSYNHAGIAASTGKSLITGIFDSAGSTDTCSTCHNGKYLGVTTKPSNHFPTLQACEMCHTNPSTFLSWRMSHIGVSGGCAQCHGGPVGAPYPIGTYPNVVAFNPSIHVPLTNAAVTTPADCSNCHTSTTSFAGAIYRHDGVVAGTCGTCHQSQYPNVVSISPAKHLPQTAGNACDTCHKGYASFSGAIFAHSSTTAACSTCHSGQYVGIVSIDPKIHVPLPAGTTCDTCHTNTLTGLPTSTSPTFLNVLFHQTTLGGTMPPAPPAGMKCSTCHSGSFVSQNATGMGTSHVQTTADCGTCHIAGYVTFKGATFSHAGLPAGTCGTCHRGQYNGVVSINTSIHIPQSSGNACDACHTNAITGLPGSATPTFLNVVFHKNALGNPPTGTCLTCHSGSYLSENAQAKNLGHVSTTADCVTCHTALNTSGYLNFLGASFSHTPGTYTTFPTVAPAKPTCGSCHNGTTANGKLPTHVTTTGDCIVCHTNSTTGCPNCTTFYGVQYDHTNATTGVSAYTTFPAVGTTPSPRCDSCHGITSKGKSSTHIPTTQDCMTCHTPASTTCSNNGLCTTFLNAKFIHTGVAAGTCGTCHSGKYLSSNVVSLNASVHIPQSSGDACDLCHTNTITGLPSSATPTFLNVVFHKNALGNPPAGTCATCHSGKYVSENAQGQNSGHVLTAATDDCVKCHTALNTSGYQNFLGASYTHTAYTVFPTGIPAVPACNSCHGVTATGMNSGHIATATDCIGCHNNASTGCPNCTTFLGASGAGPHTVAFLNGKTCVSCHNGSTATGISSNPSHIPGVSGISCDACHPLYDGVGAINFKASASGTLGGGSLGKYAMSHTAVSGLLCSSCHNGSYRSQGPVGAYGMPTGGTSGNHIPTTSIAPGQDCTYCHYTLTGAGIKITSGAADWATAKTPHGPALPKPTVLANWTPCLVCHEASKNYYLPTSMNTKSGHNTSKVCDGCHKSASTYSNWSE